MKHKLSMKFKAVMMSVFAAVMAVGISVGAIGCKSVPTVDQLETASYMVGTTTGVICNMTKISDKDRQVIVDIVTEISHYTPTKSETLAQAWTKIAKEHTAKLVDEGKITAEEGVLIMNVFSSIADAGEYIVEVKWPTIIEYTDLTAAATRGFCNGFLATFKPANNSTLYSTALVDRRAFTYIMSKKAKWRSR